MCHMYNLRKLLYKLSTIVDGAKYIGVWIEIMSRKTVSVAALNHSLNTYVSVESQSTCSGVLKYLKCLYYGRVHFRTWVLFKPFSCIEKLFGVVTHVRQHRLLFQIFHFWLIKPNSTCVKVLHKGFDLKLSLHRMVVSGHGFLFKTLSWTREVIWHSNPRTETSPFVLNLPLLMNQT